MPVMTTSLARDIYRKITLPPDMQQVLIKSPAAMTFYESLSFTNKKEYVEWITGAKTEDTRNKRMETAVEWMAEGKIRNWKYLKC